MKVEFMKLKLRSDEVKEFSPLAFIRELTERTGLERLLVLLNILLKYYLLKKNLNQETLFPGFTELYINNDN